MTSHASNLARLLAGGCALALTLAACGGGDDAGGGNGGSPTTASSGPGPGSTAATSAGVTGTEASTSTSTVADGDGDDADSDGGDGASGKAARWLSPLDEFLGFGVEPSAEDQAEDDQKQRQVEQSIAECMNALGFEYTAVDRVAGSASNGPWDLPPGEFARQYGYGITTIDREQMAAGDPNSAIVDAMSIPEKQAYYQALYGDIMTVDENGDLGKRAMVPGAAEAPDTQSCSVKASTEVYGEPEDQPVGSDNDAFAALQQEMSALYERVEGDQRTVDARTAWSNCMADDGYPGFTDIYDASTDVSAKATELMGESMDPAAADPAALAQLRTYEIGVATADLACREGYDVVHQAVQTELENAFIDDNGAELEQYRDAIAAGDVGVG